MTSGGPRLVGNRAGRSRALVTAAARELFDRGGFASTGVREIATRAGVSVSTVYSHFPSKRDLYRAATGAEAPIPALGPTPTDRGKRTQAELLAAARAVFEEDGFIKARITDITARARVSTGTFYTHFTSKEDVFRETVRGAVGDMLAGSRMTPVAADDPVQQIRAANQLFLEVCRRHARILRLVDEAAIGDTSFALLRKQLRQVFTGRVARDLARLQERGLADTDLDVSTAASALIGMVADFATNWLAYGEEHDPDLVVETLTQLWARGIGLRRTSLEPPQEIFLDTPQHCPATRTSVPGTVPGQRAEYIDPEYH
jgi:AcrR family transcriptional regulator